jgi:hypothetical protein
VLVELLAVETDDAISAGLLGYIERIIRRPDQRLAVPDPRVRVGRDAEARCAAERTALERERVSLHFFTHTLGKRHSGVQNRARQEKHELLAAVAADPVDLARLALEDLRQPLQHRVTGLVAVGVVDALEPVEVDHHAGDGLVQALAMLPHLAQALLDVPTVVQPCQPVGLRHMPQPLVDLEEFALALLKRLLKALDPEHRIDPRSKLREIDRLGDVIVGARLEALDLVVGRVERRLHDDRDERERPVPLDAARDLEAVHFRHHHVEQDEVRRIVLDGR